MAHEQYNKKISKKFFLKKKIYKGNKRLKLITYASLHKTWSQLIVQYVGIKTHPKKKKKNTKILSIHYTIPTNWYD